ncbi:DUF4263 domain-containing protein [Stappia sp. 28M-7]|uniref:DUF4263 domain-containing protein n=1 Tax=Stappia sp. 28M-7 TaxID=2762596 RepID=UPI00163BE106|nr:DUF4263 domain-containing protein [Stappia sp. 28M-7]MBC2861025.1 DUF4263 domain-containing protein [Stappia sp. 28M-7]
MLFEKFCRKTTKIWNNYLSMIRSAELRHDGTPLFANTAVFTNFNDYFSFELYGLSRSIPDRIETIKQKGDNVYDLVDLFKLRESVSHFKFGKGLVTLSNLCIAHEGDSELIAKRFPVEKIYKTKIIRQGGKGSFLRFSDDFKFCALDHVLISNSYDGIYRSRNIILLCIFKRNITNRDLEKFFEDILFRSNGYNKVLGALVCSSNSDEYIFTVSELQNVIITPAARETTIGHILSKHSTILKCALSSDHIIYEPYLRWIEWDADPGQEAINPDFLVQNMSGGYDILDLKLARFDKSKMYKGSIPRRRFVDYVNEGISQLYNYKKYFDFQKNREYTLHKYGVFVENPKLILVVGNLENLPPEEVSRAMAPYKGLEIIDYDTLVSLFINNTGSLSPAGQPIL